jgi:molecular chaperone GrpE
MTETMAEKKKKDTESKDLGKVLKEMEELKKQVEEAEAKAAEAEAKAAEAEKKAADAEAKEAERKNEFLRLMAEFDTFRRRTAEEKLELVKSASADTIKGLLPVLDDCEIALSQLEKTEGNEAAVEGVQLIFNKLMGYLKTKGLERIEAKGEVFDTELHEAVTLFPAPTEDLKGKVIDVAQTGYTLGGKVLRFAKVIVGA